MTRPNAARRAEFAKYNTPKDRVNHLAARDYGLVWARTRGREVDFLEQLVEDDVGEATSLPYVVKAMDESPLISVGPYHPDSNRVALMQHLESFLGRYLPKLGERGRPKGTREGDDIESYVVEEEFELNSEEEEEDI